MNKKKIIHLEIIRIIALLCIVYNHIGYDLFLYTENKATVVFSLISSILCKVGVPLFFMISGALLLSREESWLEVYKKRVLRIAEVIVLFTVFRFLYECYVVRTRTFSIVYLIKAILTGNLLHPYWFLYAYLSILLILPIIRIVVRNLDKQGKLFLMALIIIFYVLIPMKILFVNQEWPVTFLIDENICYLFLGYFIEYGLERKYYNLKNAIMVFVGAIIAVGLSFWLVVQPHLHGGEYARELIPILSMPIACAVFYWIKCASFKFEHINSGFVNLIGQIGSCVFGVYLVEDYLRALLVWCYGKSGLYMNTLWENIFSTFLVVAAGIPMIYLMKKLPIFKKLL